ncbi:MAG: pyrroloquinoline quinone biosynthesis peptide chaperone PqqD [Alphaproteobacteria bacterium GM202ARS2]|nr:pyrroloquinoline quinone biosynthesis peptide chaperone PqqD [Alphaproteobacteria bacterium GM202ARS2]
MTARAFIDEQDVLSLCSFVRLQYNKPRQQWVIQGPERLLEPDETAVAILQKLDGKKTLETIIDELADVYQAPRDTIARDVCALLQGLLDKGFLQQAGKAITQAQHKKEVTS